MQKIIVSGKNNRGNETRISTRENSQNLEVCFLGAQGEIRKASLKLALGDGGALVATLDNSTAYTYGIQAEKLGART